MRRWLRIAAAVAVAPLAFSAGAQTQRPEKAAGAARVAVPKAPASAAAAGPSYAERFAATCAACHGASGRSDMPGVPVLAGQYPLYAITQLFLFREGRRDNAAMVALGKQMTDADLRGYADHIGTLAPVAAPAPDSPPDAERMRQGQKLAHEYKCSFCHGADLAGGQQVPRIGGQKEEYLSQTLHGFKSGQRPGYTRAMTEALSQVPESDLDLLAYYAANLVARQP